MAERDLIVIGASTGGVQALTQVVAALPPGFPASVFIVCHLPAGYRSVLPEILSRAGPLLASQPGDGDRFFPGHIYVAPGSASVPRQSGQNTIGAWCSRKQS